MIKQLSLLAACASLAFFASSCKKDEPTNKTNSSPAANTVIIDATDYQNYVYFSFAEGKVVKTVKYDDEAIKKDMSWDLGLHRYEFRTNSGTSGEGKGGAVETEATDINASIAIPKAVEVDQMQRQLIASPHSGGNNNPGPSLFDSYVNAPANLVLTTTRTLEPPAAGAMMPRFTIIKRGAIIQDLSGHLGGNNSGAPTAAVSPKVYIVRTASGKHAKVKVLDAQGKKDNRSNVTGMITLQYVYPID